MPLTLEMYSQRTGWTRVCQVNPGNPLGSLSDNKPNGRRDVYLFECMPDNSKSVIYHSRAGLDTERGITRNLVTKGLDVITELRVGDKPYEIRLKTDSSPEPRQIRFTHI